LGVPKLCLGQIDFEVGKRCKYLINKTRI